MLESGKVDAVVCVQADEHDRFTPKPVSLKPLSSMSLCNTLWLLMHRWPARPARMPAAPRTEPSRLSQWGPARPASACWHF